MKLKYRHAARTITALIAVSSILMCWNISAQQGYPPPWLRMPPPRSVIVPVRPTPGYRQGYDPYFRTGNVPPIISFSIHFDPLISWFSTDSYNTRNDGVVPGFNFGISYNRYFSPNYSFYSGLDIIKAGGRLINRETSNFELKDYNGSILTVKSGDPITYRITYLSIPLGIKLQTNQIGLGKFFTNVGFAPKIVVGGRADIPSLNIYGGNALPELNTFNLSFHIMAGMEYPLAGNNNFIVGIGFENNLFDVTTDNGNQPSNVVTQKALSFRIGMTF
ncbi:MAG TPA: porin family protein [Bacteroidales bacterium]|nr:porin family protein [Bacteroidales bacterium]